MKTVQWVLIGSRIFVLAFGLTALGGGCGDNSAGTAPTLSQEEQKRNEESQKAMEAASSAKKK